MSFISDINPKALDTELFPSEMGRGLERRDWQKDPFASNAFSGGFPSHLLVDKSEWDERIEEMERTKTRLSDLIRQAGLKCKNQARTNYCWINAPVYCLEASRVVSGMPHVELSPASVGAKIKGFRNSGGWGTQGLAYMVEHGCVPAELWPVNAIDRRYDTEEAWTSAKDFKVLEWWDLRPRNFSELMSCLFHRIPVAVGYDWWGHETSALDPLRLKNGGYGTGQMNSWGESYGDRGYFVLNESKSTPDDAVAPRVAVTS